MSPVKSVPKKDVDILPPVVKVLHNVKGEKTKNNNCQQAPHRSIKLTQHDGWKSVNPGDSKVTSVFDGAIQQTGRRHLTICCRHERKAPLPLPLLSRAAHPC